MTVSQLPFQSGTTHGRPEAIASMTVVPRDSLIAWPIEMKISAALNSLIFSSFEAVGWTLTASAHVTALANCVAIFEKSSQTAPPKTRRMGRWDTRFRREKAIKSGPRSHLSDLSKRPKNKKITSVYDKPKPLP